MPPAHPCDWRGRGPIDLRADGPQRRILSRQLVARIKQRGHIRAAQDDARHPAIGWHAGVAALSGFGFPEPLLVACQNGADHGVIRLKGLQQRGARSLGPSGAPRHLPHQLIGSFCRAQVRSHQPQIRVDDPHQREVGKIVPLRNQLRTDDDIRRPVGDPCNLGLERAGRTVHVRA